MFLSRRISELRSRLKHVNFTVYQKLSDSAVKLAFKRTDNKISNTKKKTQANPSRIKSFSPVGFNAVHRHESVNKNKWNSKTKPENSDEGRCFQTTTKFNRNNTKWTFSEDESDDEPAELEPPDWRKIPRIEITKSCYTPSKWTSERTDESISSFCKENHINIEGRVPRPILQFKELNFSTEVQQTIHNLNLTTCTPIQSYAIPTILSGTSCVAVALDGSGKLMAAIISAVVHISNQIRPKNRKSPTALIMVSSEEMVDEVEQIAGELCKLFKITCAKLKFSNTKYKNCDLMIATPDTLYDWLESGKMNLYNCSFFSIYEADRIIGMGFEREIEEISSQIRQECVRMIFSSIWNADIRDVAAYFLDDFTKLMVNSCEMSRATMRPNVKQVVSVCEEIEKRTEFKDIIKLIGEKEKTVIFTETKSKANEIAKNLKEEELEVKTLVNASSRKDRENILKEFQVNESLQFLVLTDVTLRHLKLFGIRNVINYDFPYLMSEYINRVNRVEHGMDSTVYSIFTEENGFLADELIAELRKTNQTIDPALVILQAANLDSDEELSFAIPDGGGFTKYTIDNTKK